MSGLLLNCLLPFVRPARDISVQEAQSLNPNQFLEATFNSAPSIVQDQGKRQGLVSAFESQANKSGNAPSLQQLFAAAREACAVDHDKDVITWLETLVNASGGNKGHGGQQPTPTPVPVVPHPTPSHENNNNHNNNNNNSGGSSNIFVNPIFFPSEESFRQLQKTLDTATVSLDICVFTITDDHLANAVIRAHERGVKVRIIADNDKAEDKGADIHRLAAENIPVRVDASPAHMHHKFAIVDGKQVLNGSYNWTKGARFDNKENLTLTNAPKAVQGFQGEFDRLWQEFAPNAITN